MSDLEERLALARKNRAGWDAQSDEYQLAHSDLVGDQALAWGLWRIPESDLRILGDVEGKDVLELGCGQGEWSLALARLGARVVGLDNSGGRLGYARRYQEQEGVRFPLLQASADMTPLADESFDVVFCDYGAMTFLPPQRSVPEVSRLLRPGGLLAFTTTHPFVWCCWPVGLDEAGTELLRDYFTIHSEEEGGIVDFNAPIGEWVRIFVSNGLVIEDMIEIRPPEGATTSFPGRPLAWARRWPAELLWKVRKSRPAAGS